MDLDDRVDASFLGEVTLTGTHVSEQLKAKIDLLTACLNTMNMISHIRKVYLEKGAPVKTSWPCMLQSRLLFMMLFSLSQEVLVAASISVIWAEVIGKKPDKQTLARIFSEAGQQDELLFEDLAQVMLSELSKMGQLNVLNNE